MPEGLASRPYYMSVVLEALKALPEPATPDAVYSWLIANKKARQRDLRTQQSDGSRFQKEVRFARMMLDRAGLMETSDKGLWVLNPSGRKIDLTPALSKKLLGAVEGFRSSKLNPQATYGAIRQAAIDGRFVSYSELAAFNGMDWTKARRPLPALLTKLLVVGHVRGWPLITSIVVRKGDTVTGLLRDDALEGFLDAVRQIGLDVPADVGDFVRRQQDLVFRWAKTSPTRLFSDRSDSIVVPQGLTEANPSDALERTLKRMIGTVKSTVAGARGQKVIRQQKRKDLLCSESVLKEELERLIVEQSGLCALSGIQLQLDGQHTDEDLLCSLDRIDSDGHYTVGNLQVVCRFINRWKNDESDANFRRLIATLRLTPLLAQGESGAA